MINTFSFINLWRLKRVWVAYRGYDLHNSTASAQASSESAAILKLLDIERQRFVG